MKLKITELSEALPALKKSPIIIAYAALYLLAALFLIFNFRFIDAVAPWFADPASYMAASYQVEHGVPDMVRTPVLPLIIAALRALFGVEHQTMALAVTQSTVFFISIIYLQRLLTRLKVRPLLCFLATAVYGIFSGINLYCITILTESFTISFIIFWLWALLRDFPEAPGARSWLASGLWLMLLIFLKPAMLCLLPVYIIYLGFLWWKNLNFSGASKAIAAGWLLVIGLSLVSYRQAMTSRYGIHTISSVSIVNNYCTARETHAIRARHAANPLLKKFLSEYEDADIYTAPETLGYAEQTYLMDHLHISAADLEQAVNAAFAENFVSMLRTIPTRMKNASGYYLLPLPNVGIWAYLNFTLSFRIYSYMFFMAVAFVWLLRRQGSIFIWLLWLVSASVFTCSIVGAMSEWNRLNMPGFPAALILLCVILNTLRSDPHKLSIYESN